MQYGYFDDESREYVITRPDTPLPWINYLGVDSFCGLISNTAGGYSFYRDAAKRRILRYRYNNVPSDRPGRYVYIRDNNSGEYWSATWQPTNNDLSLYRYECRHGLSYTKISARYRGISSEMLYFVPVGTTHEIWRLKVKNGSGRKRELSFFTWVEFCLWDAHNDMTDFQYNLNIAETRFKNNAIYHVTQHHVHRRHFAYFWSDTPVASFDGVRQSFTGQYRGEANPLAVERGYCSNSVACGWAPFGGLHVDCSLESGEEKEVVFVLGYSEQMGTERAVFRRYKKPGNVKKDFAMLKTHWNDNLDRYHAVTPDGAVNSMVNVWNQYQCKTTFNWSRSASYYEAGGERGMGFRDSNQDTHGFVHQIPGKVRERLAEIASLQFPDGRAMHQYSPLTKKGNKEGYGDDHLWLVLSVVNYLRETGDFGFLEQAEPYNNGVAKGSMYQHLVKAIEYSWSETGYFGLPKAGLADWNDCLNLAGPKGKGVSVMVAEQFVLAASELSGLAGRLGNRADEKRFREMALTMKKRVNTHAWDGEWYIRAFDDKCTPVGTRESKEGKIWLNTQSWAVLSGVADGERAKNAMDSVRKRLFTKYGLLLHAPAYSDYHETLGYVSIFPKGLKENGAVFCHTNPWAMIAETMLGRGDRAFEYYKAILPSASNEYADIHWTEPYVYSQMIAGKAHRDFGQAKNSWLTGTAAWNFVAISQHILGIRPDYDGLRIDPCIPKLWKSYTVERMYRGTSYRIRVGNPDGICSGVWRIMVDGSESNRSLLPVFGDGEVHDVEVVLRKHKRNDSR
jgi:cellobiose phosphorylase